MTFFKSNLIEIGAVLSFITIFGCKNSVTIPTSSETATGTPTASQLCSSATGGQIVLGVTGIGVCQSVSGGANAAAANVLAGKYFWDSSGASVLGTMAGGGGGVFGDLTGSNMNRNTGTAQITLSTEKSTSTYAAGYREVPDVNKDDDGAWDSSQGCTAVGGVYDTCSTIVKATRPATNCGIGAGLNTIALKIADCFTLNAATATWVGETKGLYGEATWKLVSLVGGKEVWRDERTGFVWGDGVSGMNWCRASGNGQSDIYCNGNTDSTCAESAGLTPAIAGEVWSVTPTYDDSKGGMGAVATANSPSVRWRLPTRNDWMQAEVDGIRNVVPAINNFNKYWSTTVNSDSRETAWLFQGYYGEFKTNDRNNNYWARCLGR